MMWVLYSLGEYPVILLKNFPKNDCDGKPSSWLICCMVRLVFFNRAQASFATKSSIHSRGDFPLTFLISVER